MATTTKERVARGELRGQVLDVALNAMFAALHRLWRPEIDCGMLRGQHPTVRAAGALLRYWMIASNLGLHRSLRHRGTQAHHIDVRDDAVGRLDDDFVAGVREDLVRVRAILGPVTVAYLVPS